MRPKIKIIGSGLAGLATAYYLRTFADISIVDDPKHTGASKMAAGLMHPFAGSQVTLNRLGREGLKASLDLIKSVGAENSISHSGIYRFCTTPLLKERCYALSQKEADVHWIDNVQKLFPYTQCETGIFIGEGYAINMELYLERLRNHIPTKEFEPDIIIRCTGAWTDGVRQVKGQLLRMRWPEHLPPLKHPLIGQAYIVPQGDEVIVGSTFEKGEVDDTPDLETAKKLILPKVQRLIPELSEVIECQASLRGTTPDRLPLLKQLDEKNFVFAGLGSKGLLYHAYFAKILADRVLKS